MELLLPMFGLDVTQEEHSKDDHATDLCMGRMRGLGSQIGYVNATRRVCWASPGINLTAYACEATSKTAWELLVVLLRYLAVCAIDEQVIDADMQDFLADQVYTSVEQT